ncbi:response regulator [Pantoea ananatis]|uniref:response regulator n=1 Tax=Pantoea ananas TaxID=553 RepID=UPI0021F7C29B|nr:response regulator [Pantoea ananatis]
MAVEDNNKNLEKVLELFDRKGIEKRKQATTMAGILGIQYKSAKQKLDGKRGIRFEEVRKIHEYFREAYNKRPQYNGIFIVNDLHMRCNIEVESEDAEQVEAGVNYAYKDGEYWIVNPTSNRIHRSLKKVVNLEVLPAPRIAILDNDPEILELMKSVSNRFGIEATLFRDKLEMLEHVKRHFYDAYIVDWLLDYEENAGEIIKTIRANNAAVPIIILTAQLDQHENEIGEIIAKQGVEILEKPSRVTIISSILISHLFY